MSSAAAIDLLRHGLTAPLRELPPGVHRDAMVAAARRVVAEFVLQLVDAGELPVEVAVTIGILEPLRTQHAGRA